MGLACRGVCSRLGALLLGLCLATSTSLPSKPGANFSAELAAAKHIDATPISVNASGPSAKPQHVTDEIGKAKLGLVAAKGSARFAALQSHSAGWPFPSKDEEAKAYLTHHQLQPIKSIRCLQEKQIDPHKPCGEKVESAYTLGTLSIGHYPTWQDSFCRSNGEYFCDPKDMLTKEERRTVTDKLHVFRTRTLVNCDQLKAVLDPDLERTWHEKNNPVVQGRLGLENFRPFNLAIAVADEWPSSEMDPRSMQYFGRVIMTQWGLMPIYNGVDNGNAVNQFHEDWSNNHQACPNAAVLFILPRYHEAFLSAPSCEFICGARGGPEVVAAVLAGLDRGGLEEAILSGIDEVSRVLSVTLPLSIEKKTVYQRWRKADIKLSTQAFVWGFRAIYVGVILMGVISVVFFIYFLTSSKKSSRPHVGYALLADHRQAIQEERFFV